MNTYDTHTNILRMKCLLSQELYFKIQKYGPWKQKHLFCSSCMSKIFKKKVFSRLKKKLQNHPKLFEIWYILIVYIKTIFSNSFLYSVQSFCFHHFLRNISMIICMKIPLYSNYIHFLEQTQDEPLPFVNWKMTEM